MTSPFLVGLDAGGGGARCVVLEVATRKVSEAHRSWVHPPAPDTGGWGFDFDLANAERCLIEATREALRKSGAGAADVAGIAATSMRQGLVLLDGEGRTLLAVPNRDARSAGEGMELAERGEEIQARLGRWPSPVLMAARLLWLSRAEPEAMRRARVALNINEWIAHWLGAEDLTDPSQALESLLAGPHDCAWDRDFIESLGIPPKILPPIRPAGSRAGTLSREAAELLGLRPGIPIAVGGADTQCGLLGISALSPGDVGAIAGTTTPVQLVTSSPLLDPEARMWTGAHVIPGCWVLESNAGSTGDALEWFARLMHPSAANPVARLAGEAATSAPGSGGATSTVGATVMNARAMTVPVGSFTMTHLPIGGKIVRRSDLARAVFEGLAFAIEANLRQILSVAGVEVREMRLGGGIARSELWCQILSEVLGFPVVVPAASEASAVGAALCAGVGAGLFPDLRQAAAVLLTEGRRYVPEPARVARYREVRSGWDEMRRARVPVDELASGMILQTLSAAPEEDEAAASPLFQPRILVTADLDEASLGKLRAVGEVEYASYREAMRLLSGPDLVEALAGFHIFITEVDVVDAEALQHLPDLRLVVACRGQAVNVDAAACTAYGIPVLHAPGRNADAVADLALGFMLMLLRKLPQASAFLREPGGEAGDMGRMGRAFQDLQGAELWGKTVGLVGMGAVGRRVVQRLIPFGARVLVFDPLLSPEAISAAGAEAATLSDLLVASDVVSLHAAVTDETRGLIGKEALAQMRPGSVLVNTARAALLDEAALEEALRSGALAGAALDVFAVEPPGSDHPLLSFPNVIATPHIGGNTGQVRAHQGEIVVGDVLRLLQGQPPEHALNPEALREFRWEERRPAPSASVLASLASAPGPAVRDLEQAPKPSPGILQRGLARLRGRAAEAEAAPAPITPSPEGSMLEVIRLFLERAKADPALRAFAKGQNLTTHYVLTDPSLEFVMSFKDGAVETSIGQPSQPADVRLKMKAEVFDKIFTGQSNATKAAMTGKLSFSGDTRRAMGIQRVQGDLTRLYQEARAAAGGPGDLSAASRPAGAAPAPALARPAAAPPAPALGGDERDELVAVVKELYSTGLITATGGNLSVRIPGADQLWITPSALFKGDLRPEVMVRIDLKGQTLDEDARSPSSEWRMHCAVFRTRPEVEAVIHAHAPYATTLVMSGLPFLPVSTEAAFLGDVPRVPFIMPGTQELADAVASALGTGPAVLMQNHGILVAGSSLRRAADQAEVLERSSQLILGCYAVGREPPVIPDDILATLREAGKMMG
jgi:autoinducer 2 (AI-2) kinase